MSCFERVDRTQRRPLSSRHRPHAIPPTNPRLRRQTHGGLEGTERGLHLIARQLRDIAVLDDPDEQRARFRVLVDDTEAPSARVARRSRPHGTVAERPRQPYGRAKQ